MFILSLMIDGTWVDQFNTNHPTKDLSAILGTARKTAGCTMCGILDPNTRELMCYARP